MTQADLFTDTRRASLDSVTPRIAGIHLLFRGMARLLDVDVQTLLGEVAA